MAMRIRKTNAVIGAALFMAGMFMLYLVIDTINYEDMDASKDALSALEVKLRGLENELLVNQKTIDQIKDTVQELRKEQIVIREESKAVRAKGKSLVNKTFASIHRADFEFAREKPLQCDIRMADVYDNLPFDNPDGGVWKQGYDIKYDVGQWTPEKKLKVFVMPHSHNDPGWIKTFDQYYHTQTKQILDNMVVKLSEDKRRKFIWAEISFFALWWTEQTSETQFKCKQLVKDGQLEIVTGGWVMNDEANTFYYAMIEQMILGHEWLKLNLDTKPK
jgi:alpha-mannosidase II